MSSKQTTLKRTPQKHKGKESDIIFPLLPLDISHITDCDVLSVGLHYACFDRSRQKSEPRHKHLQIQSKVLWHERHISHSELKDVFMAMIWVKLNSSWEVMAGWWRYSKPVIAKRVKAGTMKIQSLRYKKINLTVSRTWDLHNYWWDTLWDRLAWSRCLVVLTEKEFTHTGTQLAFKGCSIVFILTQRQSARKGPMNMC